ncbi:DNA primase family protein [Vagococcus xieshaowenii]|uniref:DNA primase n=1 Tax=Vagococcus xieshaowenii TaxID=2562451 RepID=A0AAJ5EFA0_9ENTE|nr:DNA primase family protein [Vagococcus xieshaowenii]QCA29164.1 DNA primase [Vagococcus xieshaowenii]TFZ40858.1 DNA primase [Vagococcus xieshaowenii]
MTSQLPSEILNDPMFNALNESQPQKKNIVPVTMAELERLLKQEGDIWREEHAKYNEKTGETKIIPVSPRAVANLLRRYVDFAVITDDNPENAPLCAYDLDEGIYKRGERFIGKLILAIEPTTNKAGRANILGWLEIESQEKEPTRDPNLIVMNNGIFNRKTMSLMPFSPRYVFLSKVAVNYNPLAQEPLFEDWSFSTWLEELADGDQQKLELFWRIIYASLNGNHISNKVIFLISTIGKSGKGTLQMLLRNLVGAKNTVALRLEEIEKRWAVYTAYGKSLIIGDDNNPKSFIEKNENLKSIATGDILQAEGKGKDPFTTVITAQIIQSFNGFPKINSFDDGLKHRLIVVPFNHSYQGKENKRVKEEYINDSRLLEWIALKTVHMVETELYNTKDGLESLQEFEEDNNNILRFYNTFFPDFTSERIPIKFLFELFQAWNREENNPQNMKQNSFTKELRPIAEKDSWNYSLKNLATLDLFYDEDMRKIDAFHVDEYFVNDPKKYQAILWREGKTDN